MSENKIDLAIVLELLENRVTFSSEHGDLLAGELFQVPLKPAKHAPNFYLDAIADTIAAEIEAIQGKAIRPKRNTDEKQKAVIALLQKKLDFVELVISIKEDRLDVAAKKAAKAAKRAEIMAAYAEANAASLKGKTPEEYQKMLAELDEV